MTDAGKITAYQSAGVDIDAQERGLARVKELARATFTPGVLTEIGSFGGLFRPELAGMREPVLVASADGVGTKLMVARLAGDYSTVGRDLVHHCVNDILVQGALPLFFLDYLGAGALEPDRMVELVGGVADGCRQNGCALLGGETAEMPGFYQPGDYELVGFIVGLVDRSDVLDGSRVAAGSVLVGLPSAGLHTNGYSLAPRILFAPPLLRHPAVRALVHVTGGGLTDNLPRMLPPDMHAEVRVGSWEVPEIFHFLQEQGGVETEEMFRVFNMGLGMVLVVDPAGLREVLGELRGSGQRSAVIGTVQEGSSGVVYDLGPLPGVARPELDPDPAPPAAGSSADGDA